MSPEGAAEFVGQIAGTHEQTEDLVSAKQQLDDRQVQTFKPEPMSPEGGHTVRGSDRGDARADEGSKQQLDDRQA